MSDPDYNQGPEPGESRGSFKRARVAEPDARYPRRRSLKACRVCRARKTKCDNVRPVCGFCESINISCTYDDALKDHSTFDPASQEILSQLDSIRRSQEELLDVVRSGATAAVQPNHVSPTTSQANAPIINTVVAWNNSKNPQQPDHGMSHDWQRQSSATTSPPASMGVAAVHWFELVAKDASREAFPETEPTDATECNFLEPFDGTFQHDETPLQRATKVIDSQPSTGEQADEPALWQASNTIVLLPQEQALFENFLHRISSWLDLFDPNSKFSTIVPRLAAHNPGLLNAVLALSGYQHSVDETVPAGERTDQNTALQYYYQALHYVQRAMQYPSYQHSRELLATSIIISTYEMFRGSRKDWQKHLQGVFWILRSREIEVEASSLESSTWWVWLRQDVWAAFREKRRTYSTWLPKRTYAELTTHEIASRSVWILAQVVNFCAIEPSREEETSGAINVRLAWAKALNKTLEEWESNLTPEFSELPAPKGKESGPFQPRLIHPPCFGLAIQIHHASKILLLAHEPSLGGTESFIVRQKTIQKSVQTICGIEAATVDDTTSMVSSQCLYIAGLFMLDPAQRVCVSEMLDSHRRRCGWPTKSLAVDLERAWESPNLSRTLL